jgi:hypothetical protein
MKVQTEWKVGTKYVDRDPASDRVYLCIHVLDDGRPVFVCNTCVGTQRVETRMPCGSQEYGSRCQGDIVAQWEAAMAMVQANTQAQAPWLPLCGDEA